MAECRLSSYECVGHCRHFLVSRKPATEDLHDGLAGTLRSLELCAVMGQSPREKAIDDGARWARGHQPTHWLEDCDWSSSPCC